jgi:phospholipid/cholesterol/gamma-HCH transport system substrate-binding protein
MDQSKSDKPKVELPKRSFSLEFFVGLFMLFGVFASGYLAVGLGKMTLFDTSSYSVLAEFDNVAGLKSGASVEIAGVQIGSVSKISLSGNFALVELMIDKKYTLRDDDMASVRSKGIIGDKYIRISPGSSDVFLTPGKKITDTEGTVDIEDLVGKIVHNFTNKDEEA